jgi:hypothetical protein
MGVEGGFPEGAGNEMRGRALRGCDKTGEVHYANSIQAARLSSRLRQICIGAQSKE